MKIALSKPFASNSQVDEFDVKQMKKALNRLGYYQPYEKIGITGIADADVFGALKAFQKDHGLFATGTAKPGDETTAMLNKAVSKTPAGYYIWRTCEDDRVRAGHATLNGTLRDFADSPDPGEEINCRCWAEPTQKNNCDEERGKYEEARKQVKGLSEKFNDLLLHLKELIDEGKELVANAQKSLGSQAIAYILTLPLEQLGVLSELLREYFGNIISDELLKAADSFMKEFWAVKQKAEYIKGQRDIVLAQLERASKEMEEAKKRLEECEKGKK